METIGERIEHLRYKNNLTLQDLSKHLGISKTAVRKYETGDTKKIKYENIEKLANLFNVTTDYLLKGEEENPEDKFIRLLIQKTLDNKLIWEKTDNYENFNYPIGISSSNITVEKLRMELDIPEDAIVYITKFNENYFIFYGDMEGDDTLNYYEYYFLYYGKNLANFEYIGYELSKKNGVFNDIGNEKLRNLNKALNERNEYIRDIKINSLIDDLENL